MHLRVIYDIITDVFNFTARRRASCASEVAKKEEEEMLKFATRRVANSYGGKTRYRAMLTEKSGVVDFDAVLKEVQERRRVDPIVMRYYLDMFFAGDSSSSGERFSL